MAIVTIADEREARDPQKLLEIALAMLAVWPDESRWTRRTYARSREGLPVHRGSAGAYAFCWSGAARHVLGHPLSIHRTTAHLAYNEILRRLRPVIRSLFPDLHGTAFDVNDELGYEATMRMHRALIDRLREELAPQGT